MLALRHLRLGFLGLLVFATLGVVLEALHGFKVGLYLDVASEPRRLAWRLAHAHGTLLSLLHVAFGLTLGSRFAPPAPVAERASRLLGVSTLLVPGGFFLGGLFVHGGDPGLGVLLVPPGALALLAALWLFARGLHDGTPSAAPSTATPAIELVPDATRAPAELALRELAFGSVAYEAGVALRYRVLRAPLGLAIGAEERAEEASLRHLGAFQGDRLVAVLMLADAGEGRVRMRQVAVDFPLQRRGIGQKLVRYAEDVARRGGFREMVLHARETAVPFYEHLGYERFGEPFVEVTLPHLGMRKPL